MSAIIDSLIIDPQTGQLTQEAQPYAQQLQALQQQVQQLSGGDQKGAGGTGMAAMGGQPNNPNLSVVAKTGAGAAG
jgi:hypothetical protein